MLDAPIFKLAKDSPQLVSLLTDEASQIFKVFEFGLAPQEIKPPYVVHQLIAGAPSQALACRPDYEMQLVQVDCYAATAADAKAVHQALEDALEVWASINSYKQTTIDADTGLFRRGFDVSFFLPRPKPEDAEDAEDGDTVEPDPDPDNDLNNNVDDGQGNEPNP